MRLSSSLEFEACAKVRPVSTVSATSGRDVETPLTVEFVTLAICVCLRMKVKLNTSSSSLDNRRRNVGTGADGARSGSCTEQVSLVKQLKKNIKIKNKN